MNPHEILFEFVRLAGTLKVTAIDPASGREASIIAPPGPDQAALRGLALRKLEYLLRRDRGR